MNPDSLFTFVEFEICFLPPSPSLPFLLSPPSPTSDLIEEHSLKPFVTRSSNYSDVYLNWGVDAELLLAKPKVPVPSKTTLSQNGIGTMKRRLQGVARRMITNHANSTTQLGQDPDDQHGDTDLPCPAVQWFEPILLDMAPMCRNKDFVRTNGFDLRPGLEDWKEATEDRGSQATTAGGIPYLLIPSWIASKAFSLAALLMAGQNPSNRDQQSIAMVGPTIVVQGDYHGGCRYRAHRLEDAPVERGFEGGAGRRAKTEAEVV
ncbi:hypothetical protein V5O48_006892 [Marasmius crinis-equi]|uniref:Uncharacterized protein n=1 Tax=Marasmius crinis-equi TaxID=585013 RepID=A0ABR3FI77_9AGAR